ncbi:hypothetical protein JAAARDRAFT_278107 [Jaapia argillacea MUCL 33604]|uniref:Uncharacterized protein n=1 Tax=Jaapia argillacea MUCL 33604 TaxID=933084 RepID=A0A067P2B0_9AGAM|nr:hypothetical protein JAAARDRAFT_278107 [Jaapia argillacea MUCL 33604]
MSPENISIEAYLPPREMGTHSADFKAPIGMIVAIFGADIAIPHLTRLEKRCGHSGVPPAYLGDRVKDLKAQPTKGEEGVYNIPLPVSAGSAHYQFGGREFRSWKRFVNEDEYGDFRWMADASVRKMATELEMLNVHAAPVGVQRNEFQQNSKREGRPPFAIVGPRSHGEKGRGSNQSNVPNGLSSTIPSTTRTIFPTSSVPLDTGTPVAEHTNACGSEVSEDVDPAAAPASLPDGSSAAATDSHGSLVSSLPSSSVPLITLGPATDALLDKFGLDDTVIAKLRIITSTVRSSHWASTLSSSFNLPRYKAVALAKALNDDLAHTAYLQPQTRTINRPLWLIFILLLAQFALLFLPPLDEVASTYLQ